MELEEGGLGEGGGGESISVAKSACRKQNVFCTPEQCRLPGPLHSCNKTRGGAATLMEPKQTYVEIGGCFDGFAEGASSHTPPPPPPPPPRLYRH